MTEILQNCNDQYTNALIEAHDQDFVYATLRSARTLIQTEFWGYAHLLNPYVRKLMANIEQRVMSEETYNHLLESTERDILRERLREERKEAS